MKRRKQKIFTIPNLLSLLRMALIPIYLSIYLKADTPTDYYLAGAVLAASCLTDMADGIIARQFLCVTTLGKILDPVADKATQLVLIICLSIRYPILLAVMYLFVIKESFQLFSGILALSHGKTLEGALFAGKICTCVMFVSLIILVIFPDLPAPAVNLLAVSDICSLLYSFFNYYLAYYGKNPKTQKSGE